jgi:hypothetical protein
MNPETGISLEANNPALGKLLVEKYLERLDACASTDTFGWVESVESLVDPASVLLVACKYEISRGAARAVYERDHPYNSLAEGHKGVPRHPLRSLVRTKHPPKLLSVLIDTRHIDILETCHPNVHDLSSRSRPSRRDTTLTGHPLRLTR